jgi:catechol 2,3-dioxygenase-like lactoylglutathione lyase family enzyme
MRLDAITLLVDDLAATEAFYRRAFEAEPVFADGDSVVFRIGGTLVNLLHERAGADLAAPAAHGLPSVVSSVLTLAVDDVDGECDRLRTAGVALLNGPLDRPWGVRTASFQDPAGHVWELARPVAADQ